MASSPTTAILLSLLFSGLFFAVEVHGNRSTAKLVSTVAEQKGFDFFTLALQWPATFCATHGTTCCAQNGCCRSANNPPTVGFTIHGLWPDYDDGTWPSCCAENGSFDEEAISPLLGALSKFSPILSCSDIATCDHGELSFWASQWVEHGSCAASVIGGEYYYFLTTINLYLKYNVTDVLAKAGYTPSNEKKYPSSGITSAIQNAFHATPELSCKSGAIKEVRLCFTKDFIPRDCVAVSDCPASVVLPEFAFLDGNHGTTKTKDLFISRLFE